MEKNVAQKGNIQTQLQEETLKSFESLEEGQLVDGIVVQVTSDYVYVDVGCKSEGMISTTEFTDLPEVGDTVAVVLEKKEKQEGESL